MKYDFSARLYAWLNGIAVQGSDTITRPSNTTQYAANDVVSTTGGEILEFTNMGAAGNILNIFGIMVTVNQSAFPSGHTGFRLHLYNASPTAIADNAAYNLTATDLSNTRYCGYVDIGMLNDFGDNLAVSTDNLNHMVKLAGTSLYGILTVKGTDIPSSGSVYTVYVNATKF